MLAIGRYTLSITGFRVNLQGEQGDDSTEDFYAALEFAYKA